MEKMLRHIVVISRGIISGAGVKNACASPRYMEDARLPIAAISKRRFVDSSSYSRMSHAAFATTTTSSSMMRTTTNDGIDDAYCGMRMSPRATTTSSPYLPWSTGPSARSGFAVRCYGGDEASAASSISSTDMRRRFHSSPRTPDRRRNRKARERRRRQSKKDNIAAAVSGNNNDDDKGNEKTRAAAQPDDALFRHRTHGPTGRAIMTEERLDVLLSSQKTADGIISSATTTTTMYSSNNNGRRTA
eukprot:CAMPEP_0181112734 /NCGR_PEP_ID=MMETSP1071-20121207/19971_1 /TAXON_ID=35127 /ORGANISM="Thalassiosira sp., Strain NH16" /LENGTH=245 /DNA_ID=CAMNT_0023196723 /DNA_START=155 /DNA_END=889 /DNA_ORIENTATION=+